MAKINSGEAGLLPIEKNDKDKAREVAIMQLCVDTLLKGPLEGVDKDEDQDGMSLLRNHFNVTDKKEILDRALKDSGFRRKYLCVKFNILEQRGEKSEIYFIILGRLLEVFGGNKLEDIKEKVQDTVKKAEKLKLWGFSFKEDEVQDEEVEKE